MELTKKLYESIPPEKIKELSGEKAPVHIDVYIHKRRSIPKVIRDKLKRKERSTDRRYTEALIFISIALMILLMAAFSIK